MLENYLADLKASLTASPIVEDIDMIEEFITSVSGFLQKNDEFLIRWDNAPHHRELSSFPYHVHRKDNVHESKDMTVEDVLEELSEMVTDSELNKLTG